jgi:hypothetical protein
LDNGQEKHGEKNSIDTCKALYFDEYLKLTTTATKLLPNFLWFMGLLRYATTENNLANAGFYI